MPISCRLFPTDKETAPTSEQSAALIRLAAFNRGAEKMLTVLALLAGPIVVATILMITVFEIKAAWDRGRLR